MPDVDRQAARAARLGQRPWRLVDNEAVDGLGVLGSSSPLSSSCGRDSAGRSRRPGSGDLPGPGPRGTRAWKRSDIESTNTSGPAVTAQLSTTPPRAFTQAGSAGRRDQGRRRPFLPHAAACIARCLEPNTVHAKFASISASIAVHGLGVRLAGMLYPLIAYHCRLTRTCAPSPPEPAVLARETTPGTPRRASPGRRPRIPPMCAECRLVMSARTWWHIARETCITC
jgi:hypothetical protein